MIRFSLICHNDHEFEAWFSSSDEFQFQCDNGLVTCPICDDKRVSKNLMTPSVSTSRKKQASQSSTTVMSGEQAAMLDVQKKLQAMRDHVLANSENVGARFSEEARKIHYGEAEKRGIYGQANGEEIKSLVQEGVEILPLPELPEDKN